METIFDYLRQFGLALAERILETYASLQSTKDPVAPSLATLLRKALPAQGLAITGRRNICARQMPHASSPSAEQGRRLSRWAPSITPLYQ